MTTLDNVPWVEKYQPDKLDDIYGNKEIINRLKQMLKCNNLSNLIISGPSGCGKYCSALCLVRQILKDKFQDALLELNGSDERGINTIRISIKSFAQKKLLLKFKQKLNLVCCMIKILVYRKKLN